MSTPTVLHKTNINLNLFVKLNTFLTSCSLFERAVYPYVGLFVCWSLEMLVGRLVRRTTGRSVFGRPVGQSVGLLVNRKVGGTVTQTVGRQVGRIVGRLVGRSRGQSKTSGRRIEPLVGRYIRQQIDRIVRWRVADQSNCWLEPGRSVSRSVWSSQKQLYAALDCLIVTAERKTLSDWSLRDGLAQPLVRPSACLSARPARPPVRASDCGTYPWE